jgi:nucleotide-binding universal stress UspA family protein
LDTGHLLGMVEKKILILLDSESVDLSALHHGLELAGRIRAQVSILRIGPSDGNPDLLDRLDHAVSEVLSRAREAGIGVSCNTLKGRSEEAVLDFVREQGVDLLVVGDEGRHWEKELLQMKLKTPTQIIRVKEKDKTGGYARKVRV